MTQAAIQILNLDLRQDEKTKKDHLVRYQRAFHPDKVKDTVFEKVFDDIEKEVHRKMGM